MDSAHQHKILHLPSSISKPSLQIEEYYDIDKEVSKPGFKTTDGRFNWHCSCVSSYVTSPCGFYFRKFLTNMDRFMSLDSPSSDPEAKLTFEQCYTDLAGCMRRFPAYYRPILEQFSESPSDLFVEDTINSR